MFTDIKSSTQLWETQPENMRAAIKIHDAVMRRTLRSVGGYEVKTEGDAFMVSFKDITSALLWCFTVQLQLLEADWPAGILNTEEGREIERDNKIIYRGLSVRMGVHWGTPVFERNPITNRMDYFGPVVNKASRICNAADGGQICVSSDVIAALRHFPGFLDEGQIATDESTASAGGYILNRDIQQLKRLGFHIMELGMRKLKGLETPEMLSLVYPKQLAGRIELAEEHSMSSGQRTEKSAPASPRLTRTTDTSLAPSPSVGPSRSIAPSRVSTPTEQEGELHQQLSGPLNVAYPDNRALDDRGAYLDRSATPRTIDHSARVIDPSLVAALSNLAIRLEHLTTVFMCSRCVTTSKNGAATQLSARAAGVRKALETREGSWLNRMFERHIMYDATDEELITLMENFVTRIEVCRSIMP